MVVTELLMLIDANEVHRVKARFPMVVTESGIMIDANE
tara:strand:+ start:302 stop:415 length:114 start_codon:yes stop_codon:yes gene_type:complete